MKDYGEEYYFLMRDGSPVYPLLRYKESESTIKFYNDDYIDIEEPVDLYFKEPFPEKTKMGAYHSLPAPVVSKEIKDLLAKFELKNVQFIPAIVHDNKGNDYHDYYILHVYNLIRCVDLEKSEWKPALTAGNILTYDKLVFDDMVLDNIRLEERLVFALAEESTSIVFHDTVVDEIIYNLENIDNAGFLFCSVAEWDPGVAFENEYYSVEWGL